MLLIILLCSVLQLKTERCVGQLKLNYYVTFLQLIFSLLLLEASLARKIKPLDLFNPLRSLELKTLEEETVSLPSVSL